MALDCQGEPQLRRLTENVVPTASAPSDTQFFDDLL